MALGPKWLALTLPLAAFLGSAAGVVVVERYRGVARPVALAREIATPAAASAPEIAWPSGPAPASNQPAPDDLVPDLPFPPGQMRNPFNNELDAPPSPRYPAGKAGASDDDIPPIPNPAGRSPFTTTLPGGQGADIPPVPDPRQTPNPGRVKEELPSVGIGGEQAMGPSPDQRPIHAPRPPAAADVPAAAMPDEAYVDPIVKFIQDHPLPPDYFDITKLPKRDGAALPVLQPGQWVQVEVLEALPGRPLSGVRIIRPDGTISLGYYGDLAVVGLNRDQIKVRLLEQLSKLISERILGFCVASNPDFEQVRWLPALETNRVFVDESINFAPPDSDLRDQVRALNAKVDQLLKPPPPASRETSNSPR